MIRYNPPVPPVDYPSIWQIPGRRLWAFAWAAFFLVVINLLVAWMERDRGDAFTRFHYHVSYEEVRDVLDRIIADPRRKVVFLGGSVLWGTATPDPARTVPGAFRALIPDDVVVYNLGMIGARPLDVFLLAHQLRGHADAIIIDENYLFGESLTRERLLREPETYLRIRQLLYTHNGDFFAAVPEAHACFVRYEAPLPSALSFGEARLQALTERWIPLLHYKDRLNDRLFGQHPLLLADRFLLDGGDVLRGKQSIALLLRPPEERMNIQPWKKTDPVDAAYVHRYEHMRFTGREFLDCLSRALTTSAAVAHLPILLYVTPKNPGMFPHLQGTPVHAHNIRSLLSLFTGLRAVSLDDGSIPADHFADATHLTPEGNALLAHKILDAFRPDLRRFGVLP